MHHSDASHFGKAVCRQGVASGTVFQLAVFNQIGLYSIFLTSLVSFESVAWMK